MFSHATSRVILAARSVRPGRRIRCGTDGSGDAPRAGSVAVPLPPAVLPPRFSSERSPSQSRYAAVVPPVDRETVAYVMSPDGGASGRGASGPEASPP